MASQTEIEFVEFDSSSSWNEVYQKLKSEASLAASEEDYTIKHARDPDNEHKNRYRDVSPFDHSRVRLSGHSDYINASFIEVPEANRKYILTQGPMEHTMGDFWQMTWEQGTKAIVMLNRVVEKGSLKCSQYWPLGSDYGYEQEMYFEECGIRVTLLREHDFRDFTRRTLEVEHLESGDKREVLHFHYTTWPDFGVPSSPNAFLYFLHSVRQTGSLEANVGPTIIHCSAGIGRSGTFCLADCCLVMVESNGTLDCIDIRKSLLQMRSFRMGLIQTADQLRFSYLAIIEGAKAILSGTGLGSLQKNNEILAPQPPERTSSLQTIKSVFQDDASLTNGEPEEPPPLPPKKSPVSKQPDFLGWGGKLQSGDESQRLLSRASDRSVEGDKGDVTDSRDDGEDDIRAAEIRRQIREDRKKQTMEKIRQMKDRQKQSERWQPYRALIRRSKYFGLAALVGIAAIVIYIYI